jgi:TM2 domain-containing membrane protein YozV
MNQYLKCPTCGKDITPDDTYCFNCGAKLSGGISKEKPVTPKASLKKRDLAIGLAIILGGFGIHNLYLGYYKKFAIELAITLVSFGVFYFLVYGYALFEAFVLIRNPLFRDGFGNELI